TMSLAQRRKPVDLIGPAKLLRWLEVTSELLHIGLTFPIRFTPVKPGVVLRNPEFRVRAARASHSIESYAYVVEENPRPGVFYPEKAKALGVPEGRMWSSLQNGRPVVIDGRKVAPSEVAGPKRPGRKVGYSGDTRPSASLAKFFSGCDLLIFDSTFKARDREKAFERKHSTSTEAAAMAKRSKSKRLALTHFSARYVGTAPLVSEARRVFPDTVAARDGLTLEVPYPPA
ncbi:MAG TPA: MBL fold metallo-hydrolase, partial [Nitrososphaerales archaeon]|nr:MBL fold metallo-hydrolase [Nitrososphaerales archaeon]